MDAPAFQRWMRTGSVRITSNAGIEHAIIVFTTHETRWIDGFRHDERGRSRKDVVDVVNFPPSRFTSQRSDADLGVVKVSYCACATDCVVVSEHYKH